MVKVKEFVWVIKMLQCDRINISQGLDVNKTSKSKECILCHYWYFEDMGSKFQPYLCNGCHAVSMMAYELKNIGILNSKDCGIIMYDWCMRLLLCWIILF